MGVTYLWACDARREYLDPFDLPYFGNKAEAIPHSAWIVASWCLHGWPFGWYGEQVRLVNDDGDQEDYYAIKAETPEDAELWSGRGPYKNMTRVALAHALEMNDVPDEALRCMCRELVGEVQARTRAVPELLELARAAWMTPVKNGPPGAS